MSDIATCIIVDDHEALRAGTGSILDAVEWLEVVGEAATAQGAFDAIAQARPQLALVDVRLPGGTGMEVAARLADAGICTRVILYSGFVTPVIAEQALQAGVAGVVLKGSPMSTVVEALRCVRDGRRFLDPTIAADMLGTGGGTSRPLSRRELELLQLIADGGQNASIAYDRGISVETVKAHVSNIFSKLGVRSRTEAVAHALREGIVT